MEIFELWPLALLIVAGLVGLVVGSFLNVVAYRLPIMMELAWRADAAEAAQRSRAAARRRRALRSRVAAVDMPGLRRANRGRSTTSRS